jgi:hypothetical protein
VQDKVVVFGKHFRLHMTDRMTGTSGPARHLQEVRAYWEGLRQGGPAPMREALEPRGIAGALESVFMIERIAPGLARFRLAGSQLAELMGVEVRGMPISAMFDPVARDKIAPVLEQVFADPAIAHLDLEAERGIGRPALTARLILLPLMSRAGVVDLALGCIALDAPVGRAPRRFALARTTMERLVAATRPAPATALECAEPVTEFKMPAPPRSSGHLRLVHSAD